MVRQRELCRYAVQVFDDRGKLLRAYLFYSCELVIWLLHIQLWMMVASNWKEPVHNLAHRLTRETPQSRQNRLQTSWPVARSRGVCSCNVHRRLTDKGQGLACFGRFDK